MNDVAAGQNFQASIRTSRGHRLHMRLRRHATVFPRISSAGQSLASQSFQ